MFFLEEIKKHRGDHASSGLELRESSSGRESRFPVIALVREITPFPGCKPEPCNLPPRESSHPWAEESYSLLCVAIFTISCACS